MADENRQNDKVAEAGFFAAAGNLLTSFRDTVNPAIETVTEPLLRDGMLGSAFRMGLDELWQGLKPFPDTIQGHAPGGLFNPLPSEIAAARDDPSPPQQSNDKDMGYGLG
jgi:hypothetical protein